MIADVFEVRDALLTSRRLCRLPRPGVGITAAEVVTLLAAGVVAATATGLIHTGLRLPGSAIVVSVLPMALGLALVPRRLSGVLMAGGAFSTAGLLSATGLASYGAGAMTSLCLTGPMIDVAVASAGPGWRLYAALVAAGVASNLMAFIQRGGSKLLGLDRPGTRLFAEWWPQAVLTYTLLGAVAGIVGAVCWFRLQRPCGSPDGADAP